MGKHTIASSLQIVALLFVANSVNAMEVDLDSQLKLINKPAIKSFKTKYGDIIDCIDIYKQLAFDHPLLKNHAIQMEPKTRPKYVGNKWSSKNDIIPKIKCPQGSVAIKRTTKEDLIMAKSITSLGLNHPIKAHNRANNISGEGHHSAILGTGKTKTFGARSRINIWKPNVTENQFSSCSIWLANGKTCIQAGWIVRGNESSRFYTYWTTDGYEKTGCFNSECPGFMHTSTEIALGLVLPYSSLNGPQIDMLLSLYEEGDTKNWWLMYEDDYVGYWPGSLIEKLTAGAEFAAWGGEIYSPPGATTPAMGSGRAPLNAYDVNYGKSAYMALIQVIDQPKTRPDFSDSKNLDFKIYSDTATCYNGTLLVNDIQRWGDDFYYGGPGNCTLPPKLGV